MRSAHNTMGMFGVLAAIAALAVLAAACGGDSSSDKTQTPGTLAATATKPPDPTAAPTESEAEQIVGVSLSEWKITGAGGAVLGPLNAGEVKFDVHNDGTTQHEFVLIRTDSDPASLPLEDAKVNEETAGESPGEADDIDAGQSKTATMRLEPGQYVFICNLPAHYQQGMRGQLIVQ